MDLGKAHESSDAVKQQASTTSAEETLQATEKQGKNKTIVIQMHLNKNSIQLGEQKTEEGKNWLGEKSSEAIAKGSEFLGATQHALLSGAAAVTEKAKQGFELASGAASSVKTATGQLAADAQAKVVETAHTAQGK